MTCHVANPTPAPEMEPEPLVIECRWCGNPVEWQPARPMLYAPRYSTGPEYVVTLVHKKRGVDAHAPCEKDPLWSRP